VAELAQRVDVTEEGSSRAQSHTSSEVLVVLGAAASIELYHGERVQRLRVRTNRRLGHQRRSAPSVLQTVESNLQSIQYSLTIIRGMFKACEMG
jgi:hypothetical protein